MSTVFAVVGQHREDPDRLLLLGEDGQHYDLRLPDGPTVPIEPDEFWTMDGDGSVVGGQESEDRIWT